MTQKTELEKSRRDFLKLAGTGAPLAAVAMATSATTAQAQEPDLSSSVMQDTVHTRAYLAYLCQVVVNLQRNEQMILKVFFE